jgi:hypothetical protein
MTKSESKGKKGVWLILCRSLYCASLVAVLPDVGLAE